MTEKWSNKEKTLQSNFILFLYFSRYLSSAWKQNLSYNSNCKNTRYLSHNIVKIILVFVNVVRKSLLSIYSSMYHIHMIWFPIYEIDCSDSYCRKMTIWFVRLIVEKYIYDFCRATKLKSNNKIIKFEEIQMNSKLISSHCAVL